MSAGPNAVSAAPRRTPRATCPRGPIQSLSIAYFRKYDTPTATATRPTRFSQRPAMLLSHSVGNAAGLASSATNRLVVGAGAETGCGASGTAGAAGRTGDGGTC